MLPGDKSPSNGGSCPHPQPHPEHTAGQTGCCLPRRGAVDTEAVITNKVKAFVNHRLVFVIFGPTVKRNEIISCLSPSLGGAGRQRSGGRKGGGVLVRHVPTRGHVTGRGDERGGAWSQLRN